ncbi:MAG: MFS transporter [Erysipelotrichaceae bacterium]|nr:MFS transporter [Erysipelotrichaceae bacterium]
MSEKKNFEIPEKLWNPMFISLFITSGLMNLSTQMSNSLLSLYAKANGAPADKIGTLMSLFAMTALIMRFIAGPAMTAYDRKRLLQLALFFFGTAYIGFGLSPIVSSITHIDLITVLMIFRLIQGMGNAFGNACLMAIVSEVIPKKQFSSGMAVYALAQTVSQAIGPTIGVTLRDFIGYNATYVVAGLILYATIVLVQAIVKVPNSGTGKFVLRFDTMVAKEAFVPAMITFLIAIGFNAINAFLLVYAEERGIPNSSLYFTVYAITMLATRPLIGKLTDKYGFVKVAIPSLLMTAISLYLIGQSKSLIMLLIVGAINACGYGATQPAVQSLCMKSVDTTKRGSASSTNYIAMDAATLVGPYVCGVVANTFGYTPIMWTVMTIPVILGVIFVWCTRKQIEDIEYNFENNNK